MSSSPPFIVSDSDSLLVLFPRGQQLNCSRVCVLIVNSAIECGASRVGKIPFKDNVDLFIKWEQHGDVFPLVLV